jgi:hypothetical protein
MFPSFTRTGLGALLIGAALVTNAAAEDAIHEDWLAQDIAVAQRVAATVRSDPMPLDEFVRSLSPDRTDEDRDIAFGGRRVWAAIWGGYMSTWVTAVACNGQVETIEITANRVTPAAWVRLREPVAHAWEGREVHIEERGFRVEVHAQGVGEPCARTRSRELGSPLGVQPDCSLLCPSFSTAAGTAVKALYLPGGRHSNRFLVMSTAMPCSRTSSAARIQKGVSMPRRACSVWRIRG